MKKLILLCLITLSLAEVCTIRVGMTYYEARDLDISQFNCQMNFDGTIEALTRWVDIIEHRERLINDLDILAQMIKIIESAKNAATVIQNYQTPKFQAFIESEWTSCRIDDAYEYVRQLNQQRTREQRTALANQIINYLRNAEQQIYYYVDSCKNVRLANHLRNKIAELKAMKQICEQYNYDDESVQYYYEEEECNTKIYDCVYEYEEQIETKVYDDEPQIYQYERKPSLKSTVIKTKEIYGSQHETSKVVDAHSTYGPIEYIRSGVGEECEYVGDTVNQPEPDYVDGVDEGEESITTVDPTPDDEKVTSDDEETVTVIEEETIEDEPVPDDEKVTSDEETVEDEPVPDDEKVTAEEETTVIIEEETIEDEPTPDDEKVTAEEETTVIIEEETIEDEPTPDDEKVTAEEETTIIEEETIIEDEPVPDDEKITSDEETTIIEEETIIEDEPVPDDERITEEEAIVEITEETIIIEDDTKEVKPDAEVITKKKKKQKGKNSSVVNKKKQNTVDNEKNKKNKKQSVVDNKNKKQQVDDQNKKQKVDDQNKNKKQTVINNDNKNKKKQVDDQNKNKKQTVVNDDEKNKKKQPVDDDKKQPINQKVDDDEKNKQKKPDEPKEEPEPKPDENQDDDEVCIPQFRKKPKKVVKRVIKPGSPKYKGKKTRQEARQKRKLARQQPLPAICYGNKKYLEEVVEEEAIAQYGARYLATENLLNDEHERSIKLTSVRDEFNPNEPTQFQPPKHRASTGRVQERKAVAVNTKYYVSTLEGEPTEMIEFEDRALLQDSSEYGFGYWVQFSGVHQQDDQYYFLSRMTTNEEYEDISFYGDRTLAVFLYQNSFVFSTYDTATQVKTKDTNVVLNENIENMWYFVTFTYSAQQRKAVGYIVKYGDGAPKLRVELEAQHVPPTYVKFIFGGKHFDYYGLNGHFANLYYDVDAPAFIDGDEALENVINKLSNMPQSLPILIEETIINKPILLSGNEKGEQFHFDPQESQLLIDEYSVALWFRWIDDLKVDEPNSFQILNLRSNKERTLGKGLLGDRALELHHIYGNGIKSNVYYNTYTIYGNRGKGSVNILKSIESTEFIWTYVYFGYKSNKAYGALIKPQVTGEVIFEGIQHRQVNQLYVTLGGDQTISPFNGKIAYVGIYLGEGAYREGLDFEQTFNYGEGVMGVYQVGRPITLLTVVQSATEYDQENLVDKIIIHDDNGIRINGQSEYSFGLWTRWLTTLPKYLKKRQPIHNIAKMGTQGYIIESIDGKLVRANKDRAQTQKDITLGCVLTQNSYEFQTLNLKDEIEYENIEGQWNYIYFGYKRINNDGVAKGYIQFGVDGEIQEIAFTIYHDILTEYLEFIVGKSQAPFFNGEMARVTLSIGPGAFIPDKETLKLFSKDTLPEKAQVHPVARQTLQLIGQITTITDEPIQYEFDKYQGAEEYAISGWIRWTGPQITGKESHIISLIQRRLQDLDVKDESLQIIRGDQQLKFITNNKNGKQIVSEQEFHEYADQWIYLYYGYSKQQLKTYGFIKFAFTENEIVQEDIEHIYLAVFTILIGNGREQYTNWIGQMKTWVINVGFGSYREGNFEQDENIKIHFGFISGSDHIKQVGQEAHHEDRIIECSTKEEIPPLEIHFEQSEKLQLHGISEYGYGFWLRFQYFASKQIIYQQPSIMGISRLTIHKEYTDFDNPGDRVLLILMNKKSFSFSTYDVQTNDNNINGDIEYKKESESEWQYLYFSYKRNTQNEGHAYAFTQFKDHTEGLKMDVLHQLLTNYLYFTVGHTGKYYVNFNGQITKIRFNLGPGSFINNKSDLLSHLKNKDTIPELLNIQKTQEILIGIQDVRKINEKLHLTQFDYELREYGIQLWFRWFKIKNKTIQLIYRFTSTQQEQLADQQKMGDRTLVLTHTDGLDFSTYNMNNQLNFPIQIQPQHLEIWTFVYFAYSKQSQQIVYYVNTDNEEQHSLESALHVVSSQYWLYLVKDALLTSYDNRLAQVVINLGNGAFRNNNFQNLLVYLQAPRLFNPTQKLQWDYEEDELVLNIEQNYIIKIAEPKQKIESIQEYSIGLWTRFLQTWPQRLWTVPSEMQIFRLTINDEFDASKILIGDRVLSASIIVNNYQFSTYDLNDDAPNEISNIEYNTLEGRWHYIYAGYKRSLQQSVYFVYDGQEMKKSQNEQLLHRPLSDWIKLIFGAEKGVNGFQGVLSQISAHLGREAFIDDEELLLKSIDSSYALPIELTVGYIQKQKKGEVELTQYKKQEFEQIQGVGEYAISGWFKINEKDLKIDGEITSPCQLLFRLTNNDEHLSDRKTQGDRTLYGQVCTQDTIKVSTYTIAGLKDWNEAKFIESKIEMGASKKAWTYLYMSYSEDKREVNTFIKLFEQDIPIVFSNIQHFVPYKLQLYLGTDPFSRKFQGEQHKWELLFGAGVHTKDQEAMPNIRYILKNQKSMWFTNDKIEDKYQKTFTKEVDSVDEYAIGMWTRWLIAYPTTLTERADTHTIFRFSQTRDYQDKAQEGNRVLSAFLKMGQYEFSTYDAAKPNVDAQIPYDNIEGEWNYIYASYKNKQFYGLIIFKDRDDAKEIKLQVTHTVLTGYANLMLKSNEFGYKAFHGWLYDPRVFLGNGAFLNTIEDVEEMVLKLHKKLPVISQSSEGFNWPVKMLDSSHWDDLDEKKQELYYEFDDKQELISYSIALWYQNAPLLPEMEDKLRGLIRLTTNNEEIAQDDKFIGDRTLTLFGSIQELIVSSYTIKDPSYQSLSYKYDVKPYQWTYVYLSYHQQKVKSYVLQPNGIQDHEMNAIHMVPNKLYLHIVKDIGHDQFWGKLYGLKLNFGDGSDVENPQQLIDKWPFDPQKITLTKQKKNE